MTRSSVSPTGSTASDGASGSLWRVVRVGKAWDEIGWDAGPFRIKAGHAIYQAVIYQCGPRQGATVLLARLGNYTGTNCRGLEQHNRRVHPDTVLEFLTPSGTSENARKS